MVRQKLWVLHNNQNLASRAQVVIKEAETATRLAEHPGKDQQRCNIDCTKSYARRSTPWIK